MIRVVGIFVWLETSTLTVERNSSEFSFTFFLFLFLHRILLHFLSIFHFSVIMINLNPKPFFHLSLLLLILFSSSTESLRFELKSSLTKCISEDIKSNSMTVGKYTIVNPNEGYPLPDSHRITVRVNKNPNFFLPSIESHYFESNSTVFLLTGHWNFDFFFSGFRLLRLMEITITMEIVFNLVSLHLLQQKLVITWLVFGLWRINLRWRWLLIWNGKLVWQLRIGPMLLRKVKLMWVFKSIIYFKLVFF